MSFDPNVILGVLGVLLTVIFFVIGYRQTIGADKERVITANRDILEILARRFTLESDFSLTARDVENFVLGKAIENHLPRSELYSLDQLRVLLFTRVLCSDYISQRRRGGIIKRIEASFSVFAATPTPKKPDKGYDWAVSLLGLSSAILAVVASGAINFLFDWTDKLSSPEGTFLIGLIFSIATAIALGLFVQFRERESAVTAEAQKRQAAENPEDQFVSLFQSFEIPFERAREVDFIANLKGKQVAIEIKSAPLQSGRIKQMLSQIRSAMQLHGIKKGYIIVTGTLSQAIKDQLRAVAPGDVEFLSPDEFLALVSKPTKK